MNDLRQATQDAIREHGFEVLQDPKRLVGYVLDAAELDTAASAALSSACDEGFFAMFAGLLQKDASDQVDEAVERAVDYLTGENAIDATIARDLSTAFAEGIAASVEEVTATADEADDEAADEVVAADEATDEEDVSDDEDDALSEKVEAAVRHVAEEAEEDEEAASDEDESSEDDVAADEGEAEKADDPAPKKRERRSKQARAAKAARSESFEDEVVSAPAKPSFLDRLGVPAWLAISAACLALGLVLGRFVLGGGGTTASLAGKTTVTADQLDSAYATYTYSGRTNIITVRDVIEQVGTVESAADSDGNYKLPSAEYALSAARNAILEQDADNRGITVSDEDVAAYAESALGTSDFESIGSAYGMTADQVETLLKQSCRMNALREEIIGGKLPTMPNAPESPEEGKETEATKAYADYIIQLAGDEWDEAAGTWKSADSKYATALSGYEVSTDAATYDAATAAYYMAYQLYSEQQTEMTNKWTEYLNGLLSNASIEVGSLVS